MWITQILDTSDEQLQQYLLDYDKKIGLVRPDDLKRVQNGIQIPGCFTNYPIIQHSFPDYLIGETVEGEEDEDLFCWMRR